MERPSIPQAGFRQPSGHLAHSRTSGHGGLVIQACTGAGIRRVHDRYITSPRQVHDRLNQIQSLTRGYREPLRHDAAARAASRSAGSVARHGAVPVFHPAAGDAHSVTASVAASMGWRGPMRKPAPAAGTNKARPPSIASRTAENRPPGMHGMHQSGEQSGRPHNGTKRARIGKASGSTDRSLLPGRCPLTCIAAVTQVVPRWPHLRFGACFTVPPCPDCCRFLRAGGRVRGREAPAQRRRRRP